MLAESTGSKEVMLPRMGKLMQASSAWQTGEESSNRDVQSNEETYRCSLFLPNRPCTRTPFHFRVSAVLLRPQESRILRIDDKSGFPELCSTSTHTWRQTVDTSPPRWTVALTIVWIAFAVLTTCKCREHAVETGRTFP